MTHIIKFFGVWALMSIALNIYSQDIDNQNIIDNIIENMAADGLLSEAAAEDIAELEAISENPIDLNSCTEEELGKLLFLRKPQIDNILARREEVTAFVTVYELQTVEGMTAPLVEMLSKFVTCQPLENALRNRTWRVLAVGRAYSTWPRVRGFKSIDGKEPAYIGEPWGMFVRLKASYGDNWSGGAVFESDPGEPIAKNGITLTDFTSGYLQYKNKKTKVRQVVVGHYSAKFGQGLGLWTGFATDGATNETSLCRRGAGFQSTLSAAESGYLRGAAVYFVPAANWHINVFTSNTDGDVSTITTVADEDSITTVEAQTIQTDGYHRTEKELEGRNNFAQTLYGAVVQHSWTRITAEFGHNQWHASMPLAESSDLYRLNYPTGKDISTTHADYRFYLPNYQIYGEAAYQSSGGVGLMQAVDVDLRGGNMLTVAARLFNPEYYTIYQNPYSRAGHASGERGLRAALLIAPLPRWTLFADVDVYRNTWLLYQKYAPSGGYKARFYLDYRLNRRNFLRFTLRHDDFDYASTANSKLLTISTRTAFRLRWDARPFNWARFISSIDKVVYRQEENDVKSEGFSMEERISLTFNELHLSADFVMAHFDTDDYNTRIYATHPEVRYAMSMPNYYGRGVELVGMLTWKPINPITIWIKGDYTRYSDRETISSGNQLIDKNHSFSGKMQVSYNLQMRPHRKLARQNQDDERK